ncbi:putative GntR-family regulatory protein [Actinoplanes cyaneus]|uniref:GntR-family regulatory protein n=1 Tax=Actinoplanes cyaneus TaxID=52696 RepID=A0A919IF49_9ACTN|nr:PLP-dependent aminotransferase family protein [Actinoplanes cyaneus]MCW2136581.1 DNA-binding transcriptional regulator, MocR family, contains an aminotransferase domain [Actinoplanes cyaneus]GID64272.1 putative GntR-family regulatory protein [Actinoplanes cyaneus]
MSPIELAARLGRWSAGRGPLYLLLAGRLRALIDDGELPPGTALPTDRALAAGLAAGRTTVVAAYDLLRQEGRLVRRQGSGTWVAGAPAGPPSVSTAEPTVNPVFLNLLDPPDHVAQFACAGPTGAPPAVIAAYRTALGSLGGPDLGYHPAGHPLLRAALAARYSALGVPTTASQILVTTGGQQGLALLARALIAPGAEVLVQAPTYPGALEIFRESAAALLPIRIGTRAYGDGLARRPALAYLIALCHNPTGRTMPPAERQEVVDAALRAEVPLVVDDVLADLSFPAPAAPAMSAVPAASAVPAVPAAVPMAALAPEADELITVGSLSKLVWGGLRIGWVRAQPALISRLARLKAVIDLGSGVLDQLAAVELIDRLDELIGERSRLLAARHDHLCAELREHLPEWRFERADGGQTLWVRLPHGDAASYAQAALRHGVAVLAGGSLDPSGASLDHLRIPFVAEPEVLSAVVRSMAGAWHGFAGRATGSLPPLPAIAV